MDYGNITLFETSWEVCNKVGGIYAVVSSKALQAVDNFGENYWLLGPDLGNNAEFEEDFGPSMEPIRKTLEAHGMKCRLGHWTIPGNPKVILVDFRNRYNQNQLLYEYWKDYHVDSMSGGWDYVEPVMFATACGEVIKTIYQHFVEPVGAPAVAHFHEWMCGAGLLYLKRYCPTIGTVFTTHATMLGRSMCGNGKDLYGNSMQNPINPRQEAAALGITAKCSMETASAREADCFTTVSSLTGDEAGIVLGRQPDIVTPNGLDLRVIPDYSTNRVKPSLIRKSILDSCSKLLRFELPKQTKIVLISGRYEFVNKGIDVFLQSLAELNKSLGDSQTHVLAICAVMGGHSGVNLDAVSGDPAKLPTDGGNWITSHHVHNPAQDPILTTCKRLGLANKPEDHVYVVFNPALLNGSDGFFNLRYSDLLTGVDLGCFPSWYEPWGYTPEESIAYSVPTVTTDLSGFGLWVRTHCQGSNDETGVAIVPRRQQRDADVVRGLQKYIENYVALSEEEQIELCKAARATAALCDWSSFFSYYLKAYDIAVAKALDAGLELKASISDRTTAYFSGSASVTPTLHSFISYSALPKPIARLRELANNIWWCWNPACWELFSRIAPDYWQKSNHNPIKCLENASAEALAEVVVDAAYMSLYEETLKAFDQYMARKCEPCGEISSEHPIAYFSTEYGLHESIPIYSGGLGVLSGDHLKSASDLNIPLVGIGLYYRYGYFKQQIDKNGRQIATYVENNPIDLPLEEVRTPSDEPMEISLQLGERRLYARVWRLKVGTINLYLLDSNVPKNTPDDRKITDHLYVADRDFRIRQEILLGVGGAVFLKKMGIQPAVYHMNEGHSAFLILRRIRDIMKETRLSFEEARELVRGSCVFTTHTPVDAGNERFAPDLMLKYFANYISGFGISPTDFLATGQYDKGNNSPYEMTILALRNSSKANGVSRLHGDVSRHMWQGLWKGIPVPEIPISHVTNGVHMASYAGLPMVELLKRALGKNWVDMEAGAQGWFKFDSIPDKLIWQVHNLQKMALIEYMSSSVQSLYKKLGVDRKDINQAISMLSTDTLLIGFARRFAPYKRANLLFADLQRLENLLSDTRHPVALVFAGKAHPADNQGIDIMQEIIRYCTDKRFLGRIFFLEDYSLAISRLLVQGCDVWLNTPRRPYEASGTSGQKVTVNGVLNLSISDGWWCEGYNGSNGWTIGPVRTTMAQEDTQSDYNDAEALYTLLEEQVIPLYYYRNQNSIPTRWVKTMKESMRTLIPAYSSHRMVRDYLRDYYMPVAERYAKLAGDDTIVRHIVEWKKDIATRFASVKVGLLRIDGMDSDTCEAGQPIRVTVSLDPGQMKQEELLVQLVVGAYDGREFVEKPSVAQLAYERTTSDNSLVYACDFVTRKSGRQAYGVRILPTSPDIEGDFDTNMVLWA